ncbi:MAG: hypothetical protein MUC97_18370 [Bernardetiaceae bacterium]|jgi:hypothetical protein|nr:hypothetical protein [Bernardetiaceae bacterium]
MKRYQAVLIALATVLFITVKSAQAQVTLDEVLAKTHEVSGSQSTWDNVKSYVEVTQEQWDGAPGFNATLYAMRPMKMKRVVQQKFEADTLDLEYVFCYNDRNQEQSWKADETLVKRPKQMTKKEEAVGYRFFMCLEPIYSPSRLSNSKLVGREKLNGVDCFVIRTDANVLEQEMGDSHYLTYINASSFYPVAIKSVSDEGDELLRVYLGYRRVEGLLVPDRSEYFENGELVGRTTTTNFIINESLDINVFARPARNASDLRILNNQTTRN